MNKKILLVFIVGLIFISFVYSVETPLAGLEDKLNSVEQAKEKVETFTSQTEDSKWNYIGGEMKKVLLKNRIVVSMDSFLKRINFLFLGAFGMNYDLSFTLFVTVLLWSFFFFAFYTIFADYSSFNKGICFILAFCIATLSSHIKIYSEISELIFQVIFYKSGAWSWLWTIGFILIFFIVGATLRKLISAPASAIKSVAYKAKLKLAEWKIIKMSETIDSVNKK